MIVVRGTQWREIFDSINISLRVWEYVKYIKLISELV